MAYAIPFFLLFCFFLLFYPITLTSSYCPYSYLSILLNINLLNLNIPLIKLRNLHPQNPILKSSRNTININLSWIRSTSQSNLPLKSSNFPLIQSQSLEKLFVTWTVNDSGNAQLGFLGVPVDADVFFLGSWKTDVAYEGVGSVEDIDFWSEVFGFAAFLVFAAVAAEELILEHFCDLFETTAVWVEVTLSSSSEAEASWASATFEASWTATAATAVSATSTWAVSAMTVSSMTSFAFTLGFGELWWGTFWFRWSSLAICWWSWWTWW